MRTWLLAAALVLAGCLANGPPGDGDTPAADRDANALYDVDAVAAHVGLPQADAARASEWHRDFVKTHVKRDTGSPTNYLAGEQLVADIEAAGWDAVVHTYLPSGEAAPVETQQGINAIIGIKEGRDPNAIIGWVSHYDTMTATVEGAYDDGSGVAAGMELVRMFSDHDNQKTLMAIFFDSEEIGLVASDYFVQDVVANDQARWHLIIGHDMVGINWPGHEWPMYQMVGEPHVDMLVPFEERLYRELLGYPEDGVTVLDVHDRNSDERRFKEVGVPIIRMAGGRTASDYPQYHMPDDTVEYMVEFAGGEEAWQAGLNTVLETTAWNMVLMDRLPHPDHAEFTLTANALFTALQQVSASDGA